MKRELTLNFDQPEQVCNVGKALSSPVRLDILKYLSQMSRNINEIAEDLNIPASSAALSVRVLEEAGLICTEAQPGKRGSMKLCSRMVDQITVEFADSILETQSSVFYEMPVGSYSLCEVSPTCGLATAAGPVEPFDDPKVFYRQEHIRAEMLWSTSGFVEYQFPNPLPQGKSPRLISVLAEVCSEAPNYRDDWKSDISVWINGRHCGYWTSLGSFGSRSGRLNPAWWGRLCSQYGTLTNWMVTDEGTFVNGERFSDHTIQSLELEKKPYISIRFGNAPDAEFKGGFAILGRSFGDTEQNIVMSLEY